MYIRMYDELKRGIDDNPTIGLILCAEIENQKTMFYLQQESNSKEMD